MKTLTLLRHAKSGWDDGVSRDFDRPLNAKGRRAAELMGRHLAHLDVAFDRVFASPALRVRETLEAVGTGYGRALAPEWDGRLYLASMPALLDHVRALPAGAERVLLVGHNPGLEELVLELVPDTGDQPLRAAAAQKYPTATVAELRLPVEGWAQARSRTATLARFVRPRDLDPTLGPDAI